MNINWYKVIKIVIFILLLIGARISYEWNISIPDIEYEEHEVELE